MQPVIGTYIGTEGDPYGHGQMHIADVRGWGHLTGQGACRLDEDAAIAIQTANARLIAAAPELLAALKQIQDWLLTTGQLEDDGITHPLMVKANNLAVAAIAKAEGAA